MLGSTGGSLVDNGGQPRAAALRDDDAVRTDAFCRTDYRAEVVRIAYLIADDDKRRFIPLCGDGEDIGDLAVFTHCGQRDDALMRVGLAHEIELAPVGFDDDYALVPRLGGDVAEGLVDVALGDEYLVYGSACAERFNDGVAALNNVVFKLFFLNLRIFIHGIQPHS